MNLPDLEFFIDALKSIDRSIVEINKLPLPTEHKKLAFHALNNERNAIISEFGERHGVEVEV